MYFTSNLFVTVVLPIIIASIVLFRKQLNRQNAFLICINSILLLYCGLGGLILVVVMSLIDFKMINVIQKYSSSKIANRVFALVIILNVSPLVFFKYTGFLINTINEMLNIGIGVPQVIVPIGISFYTFQAIALLSDVKTKKITYQPKFCEVYFYLTFFTTITSGPIVRFNDIYEKLNSRSICVSNINEGITRVVIGLAKKVVLANNLAIYVNDIFSSAQTGNELTMLAYWTGSVAFTIQLYLDFSGYSDMAIGISKMLGFHIPENFNYPYVSRTISEFWKRWHMSLTSWFRDYIYIPLGGNRVSVKKHIINLLIVWCLTGIWHGANWTFVLWGLLYFIVLVFEKYCKKVTSFLESHIIGHLYTLFIVNVLWVLFRADSIYTACVVLKGMFIWSCGNISYDESSIQILPFLIISAIACTPILKVFKKYDGNYVFEVIKALWICGLLILAVLSISNSAFTPFIYGNF